MTPEEILIAFARHHKETIRRQRRRVAFRIVMFPVALIVATLAIYGIGAFFYGR